METLLSFPTHFINKFDFLEKNSLHSLKSIETFSRLITEKADLFDCLLNKHDRILKTLSSLTNLPELAQSFLSLQVTFYLEGEFFKNQVSLLRNISSQINDLIKKQENDFKELVNGWKKREKEVKCLTSEFEKLRKDYSKTSRECDEGLLAERCSDFIINLTESRKNKTKVKANYGISDKKEIEAKLLFNMKAYNSYFDEFRIENVAMQRSLRILETQQIERVQSIFSFIQTQIAIQKEGYNHLAMENSNLSKKLLEISLEEEHKKFLLENIHTAPKDPIPKLFFSEWKSFLSELFCNITVEESFEEKHIFENLQSSFSDCLKFREFKIHQISDDEKINKSIILISEILFKIWTGNEILDKTINEHIRDLFRNKIMRKSFTICLQQFRTTMKFTFPDESKNDLISLLQIYLDACLESKDVTNTKKVMILLFTLYFETKEAEENRQYLNNFLKKHPLWFSSDFWEAVILQSIQEQTLQKLRMVESFDESTIRERNSIFSQLTAFSHNMLLFDLEKNFVKEIIIKIGNFCGLFELQIEDLKIHIENFGKGPNTAKRLVSLSFSYLFQDIALFNPEEDDISLIGDPSKKKIVNFALMKSSMNKY